MILKSEYRLNAMAIFSLRSLLQANTRVYGKWEDGLRHRSIGTLVTSAEPRAERIVSLLAFIGIVRKEGNTNVKRIQRK